MKPIPGWEQTTSDDVAELHAHLGAAFDEAAIGMGLTGRGGEFLYVNDALCALAGRSRDVLLSLTWRDVCHPDDVAHVLTQTEKLSRGEIAFASMEIRCVREDGTLLWTFATISLLLSSEGKPACFLLNVFDISGQKEGEGALAHYAATVELMKRVALCANESPTVDDALARTLRAVCAYTGWPIGHAYSVDRGRDLKAVSTGLWHSRYPERLAAFRQVTEKTAFYPGVGLAGKVLATGHPAWIERNFGSAGLLRSPAAQECGIESVFLFPVLIGPDVVAILEFCATEPYELSQSDMDVMAQIGTVLGRAVERHDSERSLRENERRIRTILDTASDAFIEINEEGSIQTWNYKAETTFGWMREEVLGRKLSETIIPPQYRSAHERGLRLFIESGIGPVLHKSLELTALHKNGQEFHVELTIWPVPFGKGWSFNAFVRDITDRVATKERLLKLSRMDELTGVLNRRAFLESVRPQLKLADRMGLDLQILFIDLDSMKEINDSLGHTEGDLALKDLAHILKATFRESDIVGRVGGDEFCVVEAVNRDARDASMARLRDSVREHNDSSGRRYALSVSVGAAQFEPGSGRTVEELIEEADRAMYAAKNEVRRHRVIVVDDDPATCRLVRKLLEPEFEVEAAESGTEAIALAGESMPSAFVIDMALPDKPGIEIAHEVRRMAGGTKVPILIMTGFDTEDAELQSLAAGVDDFLGKPFDGEVLKLRVRNLLKRTRGRN